MQTHSDNQPRRTLRMNAGGQWEGVAPQASELSDFLQAGGLLEVMMDTTTLNAPDLALAADTWGEGFLPASICLKLLAVETAEDGGNRLLYAADK